MNYKDLEQTTELIINYIWKDDEQTFCKCTFDSSFFEVEIYNSNYRELLLLISRLEIFDLKEFFFLLCKVVTKQRELEHTLEIENYEELERLAEE